MFTFNMFDAAQGAGQGFDPLILLLLALLLDAYLGDMGRLFKLIPHPVVVMGNLIGALDRKLNREKRSNMDRAIRGALAVVIVAGLAGFVGWCGAWLTQHHAFGWFIELFLVFALLSGRGLYDHVMAVAKGLDQGLDEGREAVAHIVGRDPLHLDEHGVARASIESAAENFCDGTVAPVFWYVLFGLPGLMVYKAVNTMDSMIGYMNTKYRAFGMTAARLDDVLNIIPARLSGLFIVFAAVFVPTAHPKRALKAMLRDAPKHRSPNAGWSEAPMAGALGLALAGPRRYPDKVVNDAWMGDGEARVTAKDIRRALYMYAVASLINVVWVAAIAVIRFNLPE